MDIEDIIGEAQLPQRAASICVRGDLVARWQELHAQYKTAPDKAESLAEPSPRVVLARQIRELDEEMAQHQRSFTFEALPAPEWSKLLAAHPPLGSDIGRLRFNAETFPAALLSRCSIDPKMTVEQAQRLLEKLSYGQRDELFAAAWNINENALDIPFDGSVYAETQEDDAS